MFLAGALAAPGSRGEPPAAPDAPPWKIEHRGAIRLPDDAVDAKGARVAITGLSGITWLGADRYAAVMDNSDCLLRFALEFAPDGRPIKVKDPSVVKLAEAHDYEDLAPCGDGRGERLFVCEEDTPAIRVVSLDGGGVVDGVQLPPIFRSRRANRGLESLAIDPDGRHLWTANEEALPADGPPPTADEGTVVRIVRLPVGPGPSSGFQAAYRVDPPHRFARIRSGDALSGVSALVAVGSGRLLVLERSGGPGLPPFVSRIYLVDTRGATDVSACERDLSKRADCFLPKRLLWSGAIGVNLEGMCLGPKLGPRRRAIVGIADNGGLGTPSQAIGFEFSAGGPTSP